MKTISLVRKCAQTCFALLFTCSLEGVSQASKIHRVHMDQSHNFIFSADHLGKMLQLRAGYYDVTHSLATFPPDDLDDFDVMVVHQVSKPAINLMLPWSPLNEAILRDRENVLVDPETQHFIPTVEAALASKYAAMISDFRDRKKKEYDSAAQRSIRSLASA